MSTNDQKDAVRRKLAKDLQSRTAQPRGSQIPGSSGVDNADEDGRSGGDSSSRDERNEPR